MKIRTLLKEYMYINRSSLIYIFFYDNKMNVLNWFIVSKSRQTLKKNPNMGIFQNFNIFLDSGSIFNKSNYILALTYLRLHMETTHGK